MFEVLLYFLEGYFQVKGKILAGHGLGLKESFYGLAYGQFHEKNIPSSWNVLQ